MGKRFIFLLIGLALLHSAARAAQDLPVFKPESEENTDISELKVREIDGTAATLETYRGKVLVVNLSATWCVPCYAEMPQLGRLYEAYKDKGLAVISVIVHGGGVEKAARFRDKTKCPFPVLKEEGSDVTGSLKISGLPMTFILDREGKTIARISGAVAWDGPEARRYFEKLLEK